MPTVQTRFQHLTVCLPLAGVSEPLDVVIVTEASPDLLIVVIDAVGQGEAARSAVRSAERALRLTEQSIPEAFAAVHRALQGTAGVSLAIARLAPARRMVEFAGIGRVYGVAAGREAHLLESSQGTVGVGLAKVPTIAVVPFQSPGTVALAADGQVDVWNLAGLWRAPDLPLSALVRVLAGSASRLPEDASLVLARAL